MIRIVVPRDFNMIAPYFKEDDSKRYLYLTAQDDEAILAVIQFKYKGTTATAYQIQCIDKTVSDAVLDGLIRTMLFQMAEAGCESCVFMQVPERLKDYFIRHHFYEKDGNLKHDAYVDEFFKPCPGCSHD